MVQAGARGCLGEGETRGWRGAMRRACGAGLAVNPGAFSQALASAGEAPQRQTGEDLPGRTGERKSA